MVKEAHEEAGIPGDMAMHMKAAGVIAFIREEERGIIAETDYVFDLELSPEFIPRPMDGEAEAFYCWDMDTVQEHLSNKEFTPEAGLVIEDFMIRHGLWTSENCPGYLNRIAALRDHRVLSKLPGPI